MKTNHKTGVYIADNSKPAREGYYVTLSQIMAGNTSKSIVAVSPLDARYTIRKEFCGYQEARYVVRFAGDYIGSSASRLDALQIAEQHNNDRFN